MGGYAQEGMIKDAIKNGPNADGTYRIKNTSNKRIRLEEMLDFVRKKGYIPVKGREISVHRFGGSIIVFEYLDILDVQNYSRYAYSVLCGSGNCNYSLLGKNGSFYVLSENRKYDRTTSKFRDFYNLIRYDQALWSGNVVDGYIDGSGNGLIISGNTYTWFMGTFHHGLPSSNVTMRSAEIQSLIKTLNYSTSHYNSVSLAACEQNLNHNDFSTRKIVKAYVADIYKDNAKKLESAYQQARSLNMSNFINLRYDNVVPEFIDCYEKAGYDPDGLIPKAKEIKDVYKVVQSLKFKFPEHYYGFDLFSVLTMTYSWLDDREKSDREELENGLKLARAGKTNSKYGFQSFYSSATEKLEKKYSEFVNKVSTERAAYIKHKERAREQWTETDKKMSKAIDWERSKAPSGKLESYGFLTTYYRYENDGRIYNQTGREYLDYNVIYDYNKEFDHYQVRNASSKIMNYLKGKDKFKSLEEMYQAFENAILY
jgi:hypothetical protein